MLLAAFVLPGGLPAVSWLAAGREPVLGELGVAEQRFRAVLEVLDEGASVTDDRQADQGQPCYALSRVP
jgi:hypothetical protein